MGQGTTRPVTMNSGSPSKSPEIIIAFYFQSSITTAKASISNSNVISAISCPSPGTAQHKLQKVAKNTTRKEHTDGGKTTWGLTAARCPSLPATPP